MLKRALLGVVLASGCVANLPRHGVPEIVEVRFKSPQDSIYTKLVETLYEHDYAVATYAKEEGIIVTTPKPYKYKGASCCWSFFGLGVKDVTVRLTAYLGRAPDDLTYVKLQGMLNVRGPRPIDRETQDRPITRDSQYFKEIRDIAKALETKLGEAGVYKESQRDIEKW